MEYAACNVIYVDRTAPEDKLVTREDLASSISPDQHSPARLPSFDSSPASANVQTLLEIFSGVYVCRTGKSCASKLTDLNQSSIVDLIPTLVLIDIPFEDELNERRSSRIRTPSPSSKQPIDDADMEAYGLTLLQWIVTEIQYQSLSKLIVPVAVVAPPENDSFMVTPSSRTSSSLERQLNDPFTKKRPALVTALDQKKTIKYMDLGAVDVLTSPLTPERLPSLAAHAYRAHKDASKEQRALLELKRGRKRSWVGVDDQKPYAYLREAMVSGLMDGICKIGGESEPLGHIRILVGLDRREKIAAAVGSWHFSAHDFTDDELLHAALLMLQHALAMPELEKWRISTESLTGFLVASRQAYNAFVPYHNFRHVVDVLQAIFHFLVRLGRLPPYPNSTTPTDPDPSPIAALIRPFDALTLLITAIGHDVGHPGVNNAFLVRLKAPLAQLYNDRSVLEAFHCAAYSQILRRHWPVAFDDPEMRQLMINSILATDMQLHFDYMKKLGFLQERLHESGGTDGWNGRQLEEDRTLACSLLIKCADISNVARNYKVATQWTMILTDEFARQASMEEDLGIESALFAAPVRETIELGKSQIGFMNMFAIPLFQGVTDVMPAMAFSVDELQLNKSAWQEKIYEEQARARKDSLMTDGMFSPRTMSMSTTSSDSKKGDLRLATLLNARFAPAADTLMEVPRSYSAPDVSDPPDADGSASPSESSPSRSKPAQLQLSFATASAPGLLNHRSQDTEILRNGDVHINGLEVHPSLATDPVIAPAAEDANAVKQRSSDGTETSSSAAGDWASQATSATTSKMPISPSTQGTSLMSQESTEREQDPTPTGGSPQPSTSEGEADSKTGVMDKVRSLKKKPSRFRIDKLNFWKRGKSSSPPMPDDLVAAPENHYL